MIVASIACLSFAGHRPRAENRRATLGGPAARCFALLLFCFGK
jgi:hypothetical protein